MTPTDEILPELKAFPFKPAFQIGDIVEIAGEYAGDWRGTLHHIGQVYWNKKRDRIEYGTYQVDTKDGMTDEWSEEDLVMHKPRNRPSPSQEVLISEMVRRLKVIQGLGDQQMHTARALAWDAISFLENLPESSQPAHGGDCGEVFHLDDNEHRKFAEIMQQAISKKETMHGGDGEVQSHLDDIYILASWAEIGLRSDIPVVGGEKPDLRAIQRRLKSLALKAAARPVTPEAVEEFRQGLIAEFMRLKEAAPNIRDMLYLDGVIAVISTHGLKIIGSGARGEET